MKFQANLSDYFVLLHIGCRKSGIKKAQKWQIIVDTIHRVNRISGDSLLWDFSLWTKHYKGRHAIIPNIEFHGLIDSLIIWGGLAQCWLVYKWTPIFHNPPTLKNYLKKFNFLVEVGCKWVSSLAQLVFCFFLKTREPSWSELAHVLAYPRIITDKCMRIVIIFKFLRVDLFSRFSNNIELSTQPTASQPVS